jgi:hypothetical protein
MAPNPEFQNLPLWFWAAVRSISQHCGYSAGGEIKAATIEEMRQAYRDLELEPDTLDAQFLGTHRTTAEMLRAYFLYRACVLREEVAPALMTAPEARAEFERLRRELRPGCPLPLNKQKGAMKAPAFLVGIVNMLVEANSRDLSVCYDPQELTTITRNGAPLRTLARRVDGACPSTINPIAIWEVKEYYYTTSFGSRIADGVYETLLDGMELEELRSNEKIDVLHYLMFDARDTWWSPGGRPYLCRISDMLHMGLVDEALPGRQVIERLPVIVAQWVKRARDRAGAA